MTEPTTGPLFTFVDRTEGELAILLLCENGKEYFSLPLKYLPPGTKEGDVLRMGFESAPGETEEVRARVEQLREELTSDGDKNQKYFKL